MLATVLAGTIAFVSHHPAAIEAVAPDGSGRRTIVAGEGRYHPAWSPGGQRLAFTAGAGELRIADDSGETLLDLGGLIPSRPAWSPDGTRIAFAGHRGGQVDLYVAHLGGAVTQLTNDPEPDAAPSWSPDGARIAYSRAGALWTLAATGGGAAALVPDAATPDWSPDGTRIAFERDGDAFAVAAGGGAPVLLAEDARDPAWSPDATQLAFTRYGIQVLDLATGATRALTGGDASDPAWSRPSAAPPPPPPPAPAPPPPAAAPRHPGLIAFVRDDDLFTMNPGGGEVRRLTRTRAVEADPSWAPDGRLVYSSGSSLYVRERGTVRRLTSGAVDRHPAWSPTGTLIAFTRIPSGRPSEVWIIRADGGSARRLTPPGAAFRRPDWSADGRMLAMERLEPALRPPFKSDDWHLLRDAFGVPSYGFGFCVLDVETAALRCRDSGQLERTPAWDPREPRVLYTLGDVYATSILGYRAGDASAGLAQGRWLFRDVRRRYDERLAFECTGMQDVAVAPDGSTLALAKAGGDIVTTRCEPLARGSQPSWQAPAEPLPAVRSGRLGVPTNLTVRRHRGRLRVRNPNRFTVTIRAGRTERRVPSRATRTVPRRFPLRARGPLGPWRRIDR
jgi:Tol biopolymer transport system component